MNNETLKTSDGYLIKKNSYVIWGDKTVFVKDIKENKVIVVENNKYYEVSPESLCFALKEKIEVEKTWIPEYPEEIWKIPYGDKIIWVSNDPYEGISAKIMSSKDERD